MELKKNIDLTTFKLDDFCSTEEDRDEDKKEKVEMMRRKSLGLLYKTVQKDSSMNRQGMADYIVTFRKLGDNDEPISHKKDDFSLDKWIDYASPVWMDINQSDTLQKESAREEKDEKHICPLQLGGIERCLDIWTNPEDIVFRLVL